MTNTSDAVADSTQSDVSAILTANTFIADAMSYTSLPTAYKDAIWTQVDSTWSAGFPPTISAPAAQFSDPVTYTYQGTWNASTNTPSLSSGVGTLGDLYYCNVGGTTNLDGINDWSAGNQAVFRDGAWRRHVSTLDCTQAEAQTIYGTQVAHALWLEHNLTFPWRITSYTLEQCQGLFDPEWLYDTGTLGNWDTAASPYLRFEGIADYDPYGTYTLVTGTLLSGYTHTSQKRTVVQLLNTIDSSGRGGPGAYPSVHVASNTPNGPAITPVQHFTSGNQAPSSSYVSRFGCHTGGPLIAKLFRSINIPTREHHGVLDGGGHHTVELLSIKLPTKPQYLDSVTYILGYDETYTGALLSHGDDPYSASFSEVPPLRKWIPRGYYEDRVFGQSAATIELRMDQMRLNLWAEYGDLLLTEYQANGWQYVLDNYIKPGVNLPTPLYQFQIDRLERDIKARNGERVPP